MVNFIRRRRITPDRFAFSSEAPIAWGTIKAINGSKLIVVAPDIEGVPVAGEQEVEIDSDAKYFHLGVPIKRDEVLQIGSLIQVYPKRPQTIVIDGGRH